MTTAFAGIVAFDDVPIDIKSEQQIGRAIAAPRKGRIAARRIDGALFACQTAPASTGGPSAPPPPTGNGHTLFAADARLDNRTELGAALALSPPELACTTDEDLVRRMFERWGEAGIARCLGAFAFALWDANARRLILGRDCLGNRALFFHRGGGFVVFANTLGALLALAQVPCQLDEIVLANFLAVNLMEQRRTFYRGIERVPSRTLVTIDQNSVRHRHYWSPDFGAPPPYRREQDYIERARELFDQAVAAAIADTRHVAVSASGGLDSSAIAATVARLGRAERITCYTLVPPADLQIDVGPYKYLDERDKMTALACMYPALDVRLISPERSHAFELDDTRLFARAATPVLGAANIGWYNYIYDAVTADAHQSMLVGDYGNFGLSWKGTFSFVSLLHGGRWKALVRELMTQARQDGRGPAQIFAAEVIKTAAPAWLRRSIHRLKGRDPDSIARYSALNPDYIAETNLAQRWRAQGFDPWFVAHGWSAGRHRACYMFDHNQFARDFKGTTAQTFGVESRDPHSDRRLLEFALTVPEVMFRHNGIPRSFARGVFADRLPPEILQERRRGANGVTWFRRLDGRRSDIVMELERLDASPLAQRLIDLPRLRGLLKQWPKDEHAAQARLDEYKLALNRGVHVGRFIRWVEGGNA